MFHLHSHSVCAWTVSNHILGSSLPQANNGENHSDEGGADVWQVRREKNKNLVIVSVYISAERAYLHKLFCFCEQLHQVNICMQNMLVYFGVHVHSHWLTSTQLVLEHSGCQTICTCCKCLWLIYWSSASFLLLQRSVRTNQKGDKGESRQSREHRADAEFPEGTGHSASVQGDKSGNYDLLLLCYMYL